MTILSRLLSVFLVFAPATMLLGQPFTMEPTGDGAWIKDGNQQVFFYQKRAKSLDGKYSRANYLHPVYGLDGEVLTEDFPPDHLHHRGIFWTWHQLWCDSVRLGDPWMCENFAQEVIRMKFKQVDHSTGILDLKVLWKSPLWQKKGVPAAVICENTAITIFPVINDCRRIDFRIELNALEEGITIGGSEDEKGYSGFSVRLPLPPGMKFTSQGKDVVPQNLAIAAGPEMDISGPVGKDGKMAGIMMICHPSNPDFPEKWIIRKERSMQNCAWPGNRKVAIPKSKPLVLNYSVIIHRDGAGNRELQSLLGSILK